MPSTRQINIFFAFVTQSACRDPQSRAHIWWLYADRKAQPWSGRSDTLHMRVYVCLCVCITLYGHTRAHGPYAEREAQPWSGRWDATAGEPHACMCVCMYVCITFMDIHMCMNHLQREKRNRDLEEETRRLKSNMDELQVRAQNEEAQMKRLKVNDCMYTYIHKRTLGLSNTHISMNIRVCVCVYIYMRKSRCRAWLIACMLWDALLPTCWALLQDHSNLSNTACRKKTHTLTHYLSVCMCMCVCIYIYIYI